MYVTTELILKITLIIFSFAGMFCLAVLFTRGGARLDKVTASEDKIHSFLIIDVRKAGEHTDILDGGIDRDISSGKIDYIHKILLLDGFDIDGFLEAIPPKISPSEPDRKNVGKMCEIIAKKYDNVLHMKK